MRRFQESIGLAMMLLAVALPRCVAAAEAQCLFLNANATLYGNRGFTNVVWGSGYPLVSAQFITDTNIVFSPADGGGPRQRMANNGLTPGTPESDNPALISVYTNVLRLNALIGDTGTVSLVYSFSSPMTLVDLMLTDVDDDDALSVALSGPGGAISTTSLQFIGEGDLSLTINAGGRPPLEPATPPVWTAAAGSLNAGVTWNENRSYTILRVPEGIALSNITLTFKGAHADSDGPAGPGLGSHVYVTLWATPRPLRLADIETQGNEFRFSFPTLPTNEYRILSGPSPGAWASTNAITGAAAPVATAWWTNDLTSTSCFFAVQRFF